MKAIRVCASIGAVPEQNRLFGYREVIKGICSKVVKDSQKLKFKDCVNRKTKIEKDDSYRQIFSKRLLYKIFVSL
jgi:hypothetical protein